MTGVLTLSAIPSGIGTKNKFSSQSPNSVAADFLSLFPNRIQAILRPHRCKNWTTVSKHWPIPDETILSAVAGKEASIWGLRWGKQTRFSVFDVDQGSKYHSALELQKLRAKLAAVELRAKTYRSSESDGWHVYLFWEDWVDSNDLQETLKAWLCSQGYEIRNGTLEIFPSGNGLRLPLQPGFAWLDDNGEVITERKELTVEAAISRFLCDLEKNANNWDNSKKLIKAQLEVIDRANSGSVQARAERLEIAGFDGLFNYRLIPEKYEEGRSAWREGLTRKGQRHDAILGIEHYLWHGDKAAGVPALPGNWNDEQRYRLILAWLQKNHNGLCNHINRGNWRKVEAQIRRAVKWLRPSGGVQVRTPYLLTERSIERLIGLSKSTGRTWTPEDFKKGNELREQEARQKISEVTQLFIARGQLLTASGLATASGCSRNTVKRHSDIWKLLPVVPLATWSGELNPFLDLNLKGGGAAAPPQWCPDGLEPVLKVTGSGDTSRGDQATLALALTNSPLLEGRDEFVPAVALAKLSEKIFIGRLTPCAETLGGDGEQLNGKRHMRLLPPSHPPSLATGSIAGALTCRLERLGTCGINGILPSFAKPALGPLHLIRGNFLLWRYALAPGVALGTYGVKAMFPMGAQDANLTARDESSRGPPSQAKGLSSVFWRGYGGVLENFNGMFVDG